MLYVHFYDLMLKSAYFKQIKSYEIIFFVHTTFSRFILLTRILPINNGVIEELQEIGSDI